MERVDRAREGGDSIIPLLHPIGDLCGLALGLYLNNLLDFLLDHYLYFDFLLDHYLYLDFLLDDLLDLDLFNDCLASYLNFLDDFNRNFLGNRDGLTTCGLNTSTTCQSDCA